MLKVGTRGADTLVGYGGDSLSGGLGVDRFIVADGIVHVVDLGNGGSDSLVIAAGARASARAAANWTATAATANHGAGTVDANGFSLSVSAAGGSQGWLLTNAGSARAVRLNGSFNGDTLVGGGGGDTLAGGEGNDVITGGSGADRFVVLAGSDSVTDLGAGGADILTVASGASVAASLAAGWTATSSSSNYGAAELDARGFSVNLGAVAGASGWSVFTSLAGTAVELTGSARADTLVGSQAADTLAGGAGADLLVGAGGDDAYLVDQGADVVAEDPDGGFDTVLSTATFVLPGNVEVLRLTGTASIDGSGNDGANLLIGNVLANRLGGSDGHDTIVGGLGADTLTGGLGADRFRFAATDDSGESNGRDIIVDFLPAEGDRIDLSGMDAIARTASRESFTFIGTNAFSAADASGQLRWEYDASLGGVVLLGSTDATAKAEFSLLLPGVRSIDATALVLSDSASPASGPGYVAGELLVTFAPGASLAARQNALAAVGGEVAEILRGSLPGQAEAALARVTLPPGLSEERALGILARRPGVEAVEKNWIVGVEATSNDPGYTGGGLWGMYGDATSPPNAFGSQAGEAWGTGAVGSTKVVVGVIDTGIAYTHADLYLNVWLNQGEIPLAVRGGLADVDGDGLITFRDLGHSSNASFVTDVNGNGRIDAGDLLNDARWENATDEDGNGYLDDLIGWDFVNNDNDPFDDNNHGTHVSGTIGAKGGNGTGVAGVAWDVQIVGLKFLAADGSGAISNAVKALDYYTNAGKAAVGADFVATNNSWGGGGYSSAMQGAIDRTATAGNLFVAAAGNSAVNTDSTANYPSNYSTLNSVGYEAVVSVAAITSSGALASFSNYGATTVDLGAPGASIYSTVANGGYGSMSGTSMAAPHVTGAIAVYAAQNAAASAGAIRDALLGSAMATTSLDGKTLAGGRLDAEAMLRYGAAAPPPAPEPVGTAVSGTIGRDILVGTAGADTVSGIPATGANLGGGTIDALTGGAGNDLFVLGDVRGVFYDDGSARKSGTGDYARIMDFQAGDRIQLSNDVADYFLRSVKLGGYNGIAIYADTNGDGRFGSTDELVGHVVNVPSLSPSDLLFV
jgi:subtilisin family serine protease/Ca2+-binding RTX toxin-like protein